MAFQASDVTNTSPTRAAADTDWTEFYHRCFEVIRCDSPELIREAQRLRYQVYCVETGFEDPADNPGGLETDAADDHSVHSLLLHKPSGLVAGTVRLILPVDRRPHGGLPAFTISERLLRYPPHVLPARLTAEISRFSISKEFRKRCDDGLYPADPGLAKPDAIGRRALPSITLGLMRAIVQMTRDSGMSHVVAVVEPALVRLLLRLGIRFEQTGERVDYHGTRYPVYRDMSELLAEIHARRPDVWRVITDDGAIWPLAPGIAVNA